MALRFESGPRGPLSLYHQPNVEFHDMEARCTWSGHDHLKRPGLKCDLVSIRLEQLAIGLPED